MLRTIVHGTGGLSGGRLALGGGRVTLTAVKRMSGQQIMHTGCTMQCIHSCECKAQWGLFL